MEPQEYRHMFELEDRYWWFLGKRELVRMLVGEYAAAPERVVDVGCGTGGVSAALFADVPGWVGMDFSPIALGLCRERGLTGLVQASIDDFPLREDSADLMLCLDVLYHRGVQNDRHAMAECFRVLAPGGIAIVTDSALNWLRGPHDQAVHTRQRYTLGEITEIARGCGFEIVRRSYVNTLLFLPTAAFRLLRRFFPGDTTQSDAVEVSDRVQGVLMRIQAIERWLLRRVSLPIGTTVLLVLRKP